jgi:hypothetical protein
VEHTVCAGGNLLRGKCVRIWGVCDPEWGVIFVLGWKHRGLIGIYVWKVCHGDAVHYDISVG